MPLSEKERILWGHGFFVFVGNDDSWIYAWEANPPFTGCHTRYYSDSFRTRNETVVSAFDMMLELLWSRCLLQEKQR